MTTPRLTTMADIEGFWLDMHMYGNANARENDDGSWTWVPWVTEEDSNE